MFAGERKVGKREWEEDLFQKREGREEMSTNDVENMQTATSHAGLKSEWHRGGKAYVRNPSVRSAPIQTRSLRNGTTGVGGREEEGVSLHGFGPPPTIISLAPGRDGPAPRLALARKLTGANASRAHAPPSPRTEAWLREPQRPSSPAQPRSGSSGSWRSSSILPHC
ncbi:unnamed protein product [Pleuronectes platessa]|uniref:Uncharacterized protein n=1 Tax=Pleuronectes platessa TaxID=8262 RepID=A0A9N7YBA8_PLEPL|nr:unnamed protein product [Pleuronectes platessa]